VSTEIKRYPIMWAIQKPNCYSGDDCDQIKPMWETHCEGDKGDSGTEENLDIDSNLFPPGTRVTIAVPVCPECATPNQQVNMSKGMEPCECGFDWKTWTENEYG
jgi:hypothetical protein